MTKPNAITIRTIDDLIKYRYQMYIACECGFGKLADLQAMGERLGFDHSYLAKDINHKLVCPNCRRRRLRGNRSVARGAVVTTAEKQLRFDAFIDATGQHALSARDIPFPTLLAQRVFRKAATHASSAVVEADSASIIRTGGVDLDNAFKPRFEMNLSHKLYCGSIAFLLHKFPFVQGITSARDIGATISGAILDDTGLMTLTAA